jgi:large subunit ribosomal protein L25
MFNGEAPGVKAGGTLEQVMQDVEIECLPDVIPEFIEVDISGLEIGDAVHLKNVTVPEGVLLTENLDDVVVVVTAPEVLVEEEEEVLEEEGEAPEPEVVKKGEKKEKEAEEE